MSSPVVESPLMSGAGGHVALEDEGAGARDLGQAGLDATREDGQAVGPHDHGAVGGGEESLWADEGHFGTGHVPRALEVATDEDGAARVGLDGAGDLYRAAVASLGLDGAGLDDRALLNGEGVGVADAQ